MPDRPRGLVSIVIFGASGDLTQRKLSPALFHLDTNGMLPDLCRFVGFARSEFTQESFREHLRTGMATGSTADASAWESYSSRVTYVRGSSDDRNSLAALDTHIGAACDTGEPDNRLYYLALAPTLYKSTLLALSEAGMLDQQNGFRRVVIEKPFGTDLASARALNEFVHSVLDESQVFRIDHYLGKDTVQNLLVFRFANTIFEPVWNRNYIDHVQLSVLEDVAIGGRAGYYEGSGVLRDMFQSHMMQLLSLVAMEPPARADADSLRDEKAKVLTAVRRYSPEDAALNSVRGQYRGYRNEEGVAQGSATATFGAVRLYVDNWRWQGVPFYMRSGKALSSKTTAIVIQFRPPPHQIFEMPGGGGLTPNTLHIRIQPDEGIHLTMETKEPGSRLGTQLQELDFDFDPGMRDAYERLLLDAVEGDASLFTRNDEIEEAWEITDPFVEAWETQLASQLYGYEPGSDGPAAAEDLLEGGRTWLSSG